MVDGAAYETLANLATSRFYGHSSFYDTIYSLSPVIVVEWRAFIHVIYKDACDHFERVERG